MDVDGAAQPYKVCFFDASDIFTKREGVFLPDGMWVAFEKDNTQSASPKGKTRQLVFHWSAGPYSMCFNGYDFCITWNAKTQTVWVIKCLKQSQKDQSTWGRNGGITAISFMAMIDGSATYPGKCPIVAAMAEVGWGLAAELAIDLNVEADQSKPIALPEMACNDTSIWATGKTIYIPAIADHRDYARKDGYTAYRWDIGDFFPDWKGKVLWYVGKFKDGSKKRMFAGKLTG
jgi:hypothetical protein